ncbi:DMT family transporter [Acidocella aminolytica]|jgi:small multidrug resistance pump|uniref:Quaternary ammonium compound-resistance protein EmrE n=1 Tax=Acidocella aminolytica 101 = DSM 11237 TaxID=1120923 RepID=A0A0D6PBU8_9PROT|nr:multidrug efflux SMR transporter [Acidocella aminolytica]GAN78673.1 quaternary ammonium compound-resistance protein EmrE [Acidocella aminolytica 101 = DSM 11237]GBQ36659.1 quaternary ammonium compound resistance protein [Acidocella aminolytica 101 = DSM 11237]SHE44994.1 small multidrug resistance pump [Acidocella aminolytica 101 = DSM 11237]
MVYLLLAIAIACEVTATSALKLCDGFTRPVPTMVVLVGYCLSFFCLAQVVKVMPLGYAYALWCGFGIVLIIAVGYFYYRQAVDWPGLLGIGLIMAGVLIINLFSKMASH